jgi:hypothetical protein
MTETDLAAAHVDAERIETAAKAAWDASAPHTDNGPEYMAAMSVTRQAGSLKRALEQWIVTRATAAHRAAATR